MVINSILLGAQIKIPRIYAYEKEKLRIEKNILRTYENMVQFQSFKFS
jgi:hypothetical protein